MTKKIDIIEVGKFMLGIRKYKTISIDLWVGELDEFCSDLSILNLEPGNKASNPSHLSELDQAQALIRNKPLYYQDIIKNMSPFFDLLGEISLPRHISIGFSNVTSELTLESSAQFFLTLKKFFNNNHFESLQRVTLIFDQLEIHDIFQKSLFDSFTDFS